MRIARSLMVVVALYTAFLVQSSWLSLLNFPVIVPPLVVVVAAAFCLRREPLNAALIGFTTGIILDLFPPSETPLGVSSFALTFIFFFVYQVRPVIEGSLILPVAAIAIVPAMYILFNTLIRLFLSEQSLSITDIVADGIVSIVYGIILGTFALPITQWLDRLFTPRDISLGRIR